MAEDNPTIVSLATIKNWFKTGLKPTQAQFWATWDSFRHKDADIPASDIENLNTLLNAKANKKDLDDHLVSDLAHDSLFEQKVDKVQGKGLSTHDLTDVLYDKLQGLSGEDNVMVATDKIVNSQDSGKSIFVSDSITIDFSIANLYDFKTLFVDTLATGHVAIQGDVTFDAPSGLIMEANKHALISKLPNGIYRVTGTLTP